MKFGVLRSVNFQLNFRVKKAFKDNSIEIVFFLQLSKGLTPRKEDYEKLREKAAFNCKLETRFSASKFKITKLDDLKSIELKP